MRIDGHRQPTDAEQARRTDAVTPAERSAVTGTGRRLEGADRVEVSSDMQLATAAMQAARQTPDIRPEAVERGRRALEAGTLGHDADRLAAHIIASLLGD